MKVLLTGANGFLGFYIKKAFANESVTTLGLTDCDINTNMAAGISQLNQSFDLVVHAAGKAHVIPRAPEETEDFFKVNVQGTQNLLTSLEHSGKLPGTLVFISTVAVYGVETGNDINETAPMLGGTPYADSKIQAEELLREWGKQNNVNMLILRLPLLVGENPPGNLGSMIKAIRKGYYFRIGDGSARRSMVLAEDIAEFIAGSSGTNGTYNLTDGYHPSFYELEKVIALQSGKRIHTIPAFLAKTAAIIGDILPGFPVNSRKLSKLTQSLTFSDALARELLKWNPHKVIDKFTIKSI